jgi:hypothetical protein
VFSGKEDEAFYNYGLYLQPEIKPEIFELTFHSVTTCLGWMFTASVRLKHG